MDLLPWLLVLFSGVIHALWNLKVKQVENRTLFLALAYIAAGLFVLPVVFIYKGFSIPGDALVPIIMSSVAEMLYVLSLTKAYSSYDLSFVYPIARGSGPIWATLAGVVFFNEHLSITGIAGMAAIIAGIVIIGFKKENKSYTALGLSLLTGLFIGSYSALDRLAIEYTTVYSLLFLKFTMAGIMLLLTQVKQDKLAEKIISSIKLSSLTGFFILSAYGLVVVAMKYSNLGYVTVGRESGIGFACLLGFLILGERIERVKLIGILVLFSGIILLKFA